MLPGGMMLPGGVILPSWVPAVAGAEADPGRSNGTWVW